MAPGVPKFGTHASGVPVEVRDRDFAFSFPWLGLPCKLQQAACECSSVASQE